MEDRYLWPLYAIKENSIRLWLCDQLGDVDNVPLDAFRTYFQTGSGKFVFNGWYESPD